MTGDGTGPSDDHGPDGLGIDGLRIDGVGLDGLGIDRLGTDRLGIDGLGIDGLRIDRHRIDRHRIDRLGDVADLRVLAETDTLLDRLGGRRPSVEDLDDLAIAALALLAAEVDLPEVSRDALRRELVERGVWPPVPVAGSADLPETQVLDARSPGESAGPAVPGTGGTGEGGPERSPGRDRAVDRLFPGPGRPVEPGRHREAARPPRQVHVRVLTVAACAAVGLYGVGALVTGAWNPVRAGSIIAGTDDATRIEHLLTEGLTLVSSNEVQAGQANLERAWSMTRTADLSPQQQATIDQLLHDLSTALTRKNVPLPRELQPGAIASRRPPGPIASQPPGEVPTSAAAQVPAATTTAPVAPTASASTTDAEGDGSPTSGTTAEPEPSATTSTTSSPSASTSTSPMPGKSPTTKSKPPAAGNGKAVGRS